MIILSFYNQSLCLVNIYCNYAANCNAKPMEYGIVRPEKVLIFFWILDRLEDFATLA